MFKEMMNKQGITVMSNQQETTKNDQPDLKREPEWTMDNNTAEDRINELEDISQ